MAHSLLPSLYLQVFFLYLGQPPVATYHKTLCHPSGALSDHVTSAKLCASSLRLSFDGAWLLICQVLGLAWQKLVLVAPVTVGIPVLAFRSAGFGHTT